MQHMPVCKHVCQQGDSKYDRNKQVNACAVTVAVCVMMRFSVTILVAYNFVAKVVYCVIYFVNISFFYYSKADFSGSSVGRNVFGTFFLQHFRDSEGAVAAGHTLYI